MNPSKSHDSNSSAAVIGGLAFIVILVLIALYFWGARVSLENQATRVNIDGPSIQSTSPGDTTADIEAQLDLFSPDELPTSDPKIESVVEAD
jgi:hypothetical protein